MRPVSGTLSLPSRGTFHHSLTVLFTIGHQGVFRLDGWSRQIHAKFHESRATWGHSHQWHAHVYGTLTHSGTPSQTLRLHTPFITGRTDGSRSRETPQPRACNTCRLEHTHGLASSAFARHYSRNHCCFLFLRVLRCFTSPRSLPHPYTFRAGSPDMTPAIQGFPIRTPPDHSSSTNSPGLIAGYNVLHRLLVPRHPPTALSSLQHMQNSTKMLISTVQFSTTTRDTHHQPRTSRQPRCPQHPRNHHATAVIPQNPNSVPTTTSPPHRRTGDSTAVNVPQKQPPAPHGHQQPGPAPTPNRMDGQTEKAP